MSGSSRLVTQNTKYSFTYLNNQEKGGFLLMVKLNMTKNIHLIQQNSHLIFTYKELNAQYRN